MKPILKYPGAKWALASWIAKYLPETPHYVEPFCGSAAVYFNLPWRPKHAVLNDLSGDIVNLFRVIRERGDELVALVEMTPWSREEYERSYEPCDDPLERARRWTVRIWQAFGARAGNRTGWAHAGTSDQNVTSRWRSLPDALVAAIGPLREAEIECRPALEVITRMASPDALIYADPPYVKGTRSGWRSKRDTYQFELDDADHAALLDALDAHPGPVALSGYACALYDDRLTHWRRVETQVSAERGNTRTECLWLNKTLQERLSLGPLFAGLEPAA